MKYKIVELLIKNFTLSIQQKSFVYSDFLRQLVHLYMSQLGFSGEIQKMSFACTETEEKQIRSAHDIFTEVLSLL